MFEQCGKAELKTLLAIEPGDPISGVARKIDENRETIRRTVNRLEDAGYIQYDGGLSIVDDAVRETGLAFLAATAAVSPALLKMRYGVRIAGFRSSQMTVPHRSSDKIV